jgi:hypothetical protein
MVGDGGMSIRKWREIFKPGWVAKVRLLIIASEASILSQSGMYYKVD